MLAGEKRQIPILSVVLTFFVNMASGILTKGKSGLRMIPNEDKDRSPFTIEEPPWQPDEKYSSCVKCKADFDFWKRRHHCRRCGNVFCGSCCDHKVLLPRLNFVDPVRVCEECATVAKKENVFFDKYLKILTHGADFIVGEASEEIMHCKLNPKNHREVSVGKTHDVIDLTKLISVKTVSDNPETQGSSLPLVTGLIFKYKNESTNSVEIIQLHALQPLEDGRKASLSWIVAMQKAVKILFEAGN